MSLIPSESASFPDLLGRGLGASKRSKWRESHALGQPPPPPPKIEPPSETAPPASRVEEKLDPVASEVTPSMPLAPDSVGNVEPPPDKAPPLLPEKMSGPIGSELTPITLPPPAKIESVSETALDAGAVKPGNSDLGHLAALLAGPPKIEPSPGVTAPSAEGDERFKPPGPELTPLKPLSQVEKQTPPSDAALEKIPDRLPTTSEKAVPELSAVARDLNTADTGQPESSTAPVSPGTENPESDTYQDYLAPEIATRHEDFEFAEPAAKRPDAQRRARNKFFGFVSCEIVVVALLVVSILFGWSHRLGSGSLAKAGAIVTAIAVVALPIIFYGFPKTRPRDRLDRSLGQRYRLNRD